MRRLTAFLFFLLVSVSAYAEVSETIRSFFPDAASLPGDSSWIMGSIDETPQGDCSVYSTGYVYYSLNPTFIFSMKREATYSVDVRIYACNNFVNAFNLYKKLGSVGDKKRKREVPFGERGMMHYFPIKGETLKADYYLTFLSRVFVVQLHSNDGFALMDLANVVQKNVVRYLLANRERFMLNRLTVQAERTGFHPIKEEITFTSDDVTGVSLKGQVFDNALVPLDNVTVRMLETGSEAVTNENGEYQLDFSFAEGKTLDFVRSFYLTREGGFVGPVRSGLANGMYGVSVDYRNGKKEQSAWKLSVDGEDVSGISFDLETRKQYRLFGTLKGNQLSLIRNCAPPFSTFKCRQTFTGTVTPNGVDGLWQGTGGGGSFLLDPTAYTTETAVLPLDANVADMQTVTFAYDTMTQDPQMLKTASAEGVASYIQVKGKGEAFVDDGFFFREAFLDMTHLPTGQKEILPLYLFPLQEPLSGKTLRNIKPEKLPRALPAEEPYALHFPLQAYQANAPYGFLIGPRVNEVTEAQHFFAPPGGYALLSPKLRVISYVAGKKETSLAPVTVVLDNFNGSDDFVGNSNTIRRDGAGDIALSLILRTPDKTVHEVEITASGGQRRVWNTNSLDIYPVVGMFAGGSAVNQPDGSVSYAVSGSKESLKLYLYRGSLQKKEVSSFSYRIRVGSIWYTGTVQGSTADK